jgi:hypothetical protein
MRIDPPESHRGGKGTGAPRGALAGEGLVDVSRLCATRPAHSALLNEYIIDAAGTA